MNIQLYCPQCEAEVEKLHEGYCKDCCEENQQNLDDHNAQLGYWNSLTESERSQAIREKSK